LTPQLQDGLALQIETRKSTEVPRTIVGGLFECKSE
jgi:hypothetical protein